MSEQGNNQFFGTYTSDGNRKILEFPSDVNYIEIQNLTQFASTANPGKVKRAFWNSTMDAGSFMAVKNTNGAATDESITGTAGGFRPIRSDVVQSFAPTAVTAVSQAAAAVVSSTAHGLETGDIVHLANITNMQQISGYDFVVTKIDANSFSIPVDSSGFAAPGAGGSARRREFDLKEYKPRTREVVGISNAAQAVINVNLDQTYKVGDLVKFNVPAAFGMTEINDKEVRIVAINSSTEFVVDLDSTGFTAFAFPTSAAAAPGAGTEKARVIPIGRDAIFDANDQIFQPNPTANAGIRGIEIGTAVGGEANDVIKFVALSASSLN